MMELTNLLYKVDAAGEGAAVLREAAIALTQMLNPFAPHITRACWQALGQTDPIEDATWPEHDESLLVADAVTLSVQVNGKMRGRVEVPASAEGLVEMKQFFLYALPAIQAAMWVLILFAGWYIASGIVRMSGRSKRPKDDIPSQLRMPRMAAMVLVVGVAMSFIDGDQADLHGA